MKNFKLNKDDKKVVYIIGIGGISLSAIAYFLRSWGYQVCGSDIHENEQTEKLKKDGFDVKICSSSPDFVMKCDVVIYTSAIDVQNEDVLLAKKMKKIILSRAEVLGEISKHYKTISVAGTHGKTTTTGMISCLLRENNFRPNIHIGGVLNNINSNYCLGESDVLVTEACEYKDSFLTLKNYVSVVLNIKEDHLDYFHNLKNIFSSFKKFVKNTNKNGCTVLNYDDPLSAKLKPKSNIISFAIKNNATVVAKNIKKIGCGKYCFDVFYHNIKLGNINLPCYGYHNIYNALASICVGIIFEIDFKNIKSGLEKFGGVKRRNELLFENENVVVFHDYAHHPDEIKATLNSYKDLGFDKIVTIFQPHTFSRTKDLHNDFVTCFEKSDKVFLLPIYPAREKPIEGVTSRLLADDIKKQGKDCDVFQSFEECEDVLEKEYLQFDKNLNEVKLSKFVKKNDKKVKNFNKNKKFQLKNTNKEINKLVLKKQEKTLIAFLGAGDINLLAEKIANKLKAKLF